MISQRLATDFLRATTTSRYRRQAEGPTVTERLGEITATAAGPPLSVSLKLGGSTVVLTGIRYVSGYSPTIGDIVRVRVRGTDLCVLGKIA